MANVTITSSGTYSTYALMAPVTNGTNIDFLNNNDSVGGVLILADNAANSAFNITTTTVGGSLYASANIGGTVLNFQPGVYPGITGDQITLQVIKTLFTELDVATTASTDNAAFDGDITVASQSGLQFLILPDGKVEPTVESPFTLDANTQLVIEEMARAMFGTAMAADDATLDLAFALRTNPNSNHPFVDGVFTTENPVNPCFAAGTRILTAHGEVPVEDLKAGDLLITHAGEEQPIIWIGRREVEIATHPRPETVRPILIEADALRDGVPARRLVLSPDHAFLLDGVLVPAKALVNWTTIRPDETARRVTYFHFELARHDIIFAEAAPAETFLDTGHRGIFDNATPATIANPTLMQHRRNTESCAPLCLGGPVLETIRQRLAARQVGVRLA